MKGLFWVGPLLFLLAQIILPGGSADVATRIGIIQANTTAWEWGHLLIVLAFVLLLPWLAQLYREVRKTQPVLAYLGAFLVAIGIASDYAVAVLQLLSLELVRGSTATTPEVLKLFNSPNLMLTVFMPYIGFLLGFVLLGLGLWQQGRSLDALSLALAGLLIFAGGMAQSKLLFVLGGLALLLATWYILKPNPAADQRKANFA